MDWHEQSRQIQLQSFIVKDRASRFYRFLVGLGYHAQVFFHPFQVVWFLLSAPKEATPLCYGSSMVTLYIFNNEKKCYICIQLTKMKSCCRRKTKEMMSIETWNPFQKQLFQTQYGGTWRHSTYISGDYPLKALGADHFLGCAIKQKSSKVIVAQLQELSIKTSHPHD